MIKPLPLIVRKEKQLVLKNRTAKRAAEHVPAKFVFRGWPSASKIIRPAIGVQNVVPEELPRIAVKAVRPGFNCRADDTALEIPEFGRSVAGNEVEFLNCVRRRRIAKQVIRHLVVVHAIEQKVIGLVAISVDVRALRTEARVVTGVESIWIDRDRPRSQKGELYIIASRQWQRVVRRRVNNGVDLSRIRLQNRRIAANFYGHRDIADFQSHVNTRSLVQYQSEGLADYRRETFCFDSQSVGSNRNPQ